MTVQSEITRLENAKESIATAITNKGVTVPSGTKLDGMAALIGSIESGGGGGGDVDFSPFAKVSWGTIIPATDITMIPASSFGLQDFDNMLFFCIQAEEQPAGNDYIIGGSYTYNKFESNSQNAHIGMYRKPNGSGGSGQWVVAWGNSLLVSVKLSAGVPYRYVICLE